MKPEFDNCRNCGERIARLSSGEPWHHFGGAKPCRDSARWSVAVAAPASEKPFWEKR